MPLRVIDNFPKLGICKLHYLLPPCQRGLFLYSFWQLHLCSSCSGAVISESLLTSPSLLSFTKHQSQAPDPGVLLPHPVLSRIPAAGGVLHHQIRLSAPPLSWRCSLLPELSVISLGFLPVSHAVHSSGSPSPFFYLNSTSCPWALSLLSLTMPGHPLPCVPSCVPSPHPICPSRPKQVPCLP